MLELNLYRNKMTTSKGYGMIYGRVEKKETYDLAKLAEHMHNHNSPYSAGVILGILKDMVSCIRELCLEGNQVKIADLAIFSVQIASKGANSFLAYDIAKHVKDVHLNAYSTGVFRRAELIKDGVIGYTSLAQSLRDAERPQPEPTPDPGDDDDDDGD